MSAGNLKTEGYVSLKYCVMSFLNAINEYSLRNYKRYMQFCIEGFTELNIKHLRTFEVAYLPVDTTTMTVVIPSDCVDYKVIGVIIDGQIWTLTKKDILGIPRAESCGVVPKLEVATNTIDYNSVYLDTPYLTALYASPGAQNEAYYKIDWERRLIILAGEVRSNTVYLEYLSSGVSLTQATNVPRECVPALKAYMNWQRIENDRTYPMNDKMKKQNDWNIEVSKLYAFTHSFTKDEFLDAKYANAYQTPKR